MAALGSRWAGHVYGTNTGNVFLELESADEAVAGVLRFNDQVHGLVVYEVEGTFDGSALNLAGKPTELVPGIEMGELTVSGRLAPEGNIIGDWKSTIGTGGTFALFPHDPPMVVPGGDVQLAERLHTEVRNVGALRVYAADLADLVAQIRADFKIGRVIIAYRVRGQNETLLYADTFLAMKHPAERLLHLRIMVQEPEPGTNLNRVLVIEFNKEGENLVRAQGVQESWVIGIAERVAAMLRMRQKVLIATVSKHGLNFNGFLAIITLILLPELPLVRRAAFVAVVLVAVLAISALHRRYVPNAVIYLGERKPGWFERTVRPQLASGLMAIATGLVSAIAYGLLKGELAWPAWVAQVLH